MIEFQDWRPQIDNDADTNKNEALPLHLFWSLRRLASENGDLIRYDKTNIIGIYTNTLNSSLMRGVGKFDANLAPRCQPALIPNIHKHYNEQFDETQTKTKYNHLCDRMQVKP